MTVKLFDVSTGREIKVNDEVKTFRGEPAKVRGFTAPRHAGSTGLVSIEVKRSVRECYPSVINAEIRDD